MLRIDGPVTMPLLMVTTKTIRFPVRRRGRHAAGTDGRDGRDAVAVSNSKYRLSSERSGALKGTERGTPTGGVFQPDSCRRCVSCDTDSSEMRSYRDRTTAGRGPRFSPQKQFLIGFLAASPQGCGRILEVNGTFAVVILSDSSQVVTMPLRSLRLLPAKRFRKKCKRDCAGEPERKGKTVWARFPLYVPETEWSWRASWTLLLDILLGRVTQDVVLYMSTLRQILDLGQERQEVNPCLCNGPLDRVIRLAGFSPDALRIDGEKAFLFPRVQTSSSSSIPVQSFVPVPGIVPYVTRRLPPPAASEGDFRYLSGYRARGVQFPPRLSQKDVQTVGGNLVIRGLDVRQVARVHDYAIVSGSRGFPFITSASLSVLP